MSVLELAIVPGVPQTPGSVLYPEGVLGPGVLWPLLPPMWKKAGPPSPALRAGDTGPGLGGWTISMGRGCG
eukprot:2208625-Alexandrium_andersonii.AAC.1